MEGNSISQAIQITANNREYNFGHLVNQSNKKSEQITQQEIAKAIFYLSIMIKPSIYFKMGNTTEIIKMNGFKKNSNILLNIKLSKLRDYFASFKSICDNFSIDLTEFEHIFETGESSFVVWDTDNNGLIDSLELFSGLAIFSQTKIEDKIRFLFDVFDFNEVEFLELIELQFLIYCSINASFKIFSIPNEVINQEIEQFVHQLFPEATKITVADLIKKGRQHAKIKQFFQLLQSETNIKKKNDT